MKLRLTFYLVALSLASPLAAQVLRFSPEATDACLADRTGPDSATCIGKAAAACVAATLGATEIDAASCLNAETEWWRGRMDAAYALAERKAALLDVEFAQAISQGGSRMTADLATMQAAWADWSEKRCFFAAIERRGKPDRTEVASACMLHQTATQALLLEAAADKRKTRK